MKLDIECNQTSYKVMIQRAVHEIIDKPVVMNDEIPMKLLECINDGVASLKEATENDDIMSRILRGSLISRSMYSMNLIKKNRDRVRQIIFLGGGLDTISFSLSDEHKDLTFFEVDCGEDALKKKLILDKENKKPIKIINHDIESNDLFNHLEMAGVDFSEPVGIIMLGVSIYLQENNFYTLLKKIKKIAANGSYMAFDYYIPIDRIPAKYREILTSRFELLNNLGEPIVFTADTIDMVERIKELGFSKIENVSADELNSTYLLNHSNIKVEGYFNIISFSI
ncbi:hypothetical protein BIY26_21250 [Brenneria goodwinii]|uniref:S-adenosyl-L-methionine-dependent methyltransferase n=1 Tax=Brenneria goodwinii TaxID=1109412 RepID=A0AAE8EKL1_9GAMM|nr:class I SAM-dependent methyltransferase [Brenneria goodwinii]RLM17190.1 hypothetical protein BIY26_21250 [Brenneria goodwinii]